MKSSYDVLVNNHTSTREAKLKARGCFGFNPIETKDINQNIL